MKPTRWLFGATSNRGWEP